MAHQTITIAVPQETYEPFRERAERAQRSVEDAVVEAIQTALDGGESVAEDRQTVLTGFRSVDAGTLRQIVARGAETEDVLSDRPE